MLLVEIEKKRFLFLVWRFLGGLPQGFFFCFFWPPLPGPGPQPIEPLFWLKFFWKLGENPHFFIP